jgi:predicted O-methyltransferase YrrM
MLIVNPDAEYLLFDLNRHAYTEPTLNYIKSQFPNTKFDVFFGDSVQTIDKFILDNPDQLNSYDLIHLDGGHSPEVYTEDFNNSRHLITNDGIVIFDDSHHDNIRELINTNIKDNIISEFIDSNITITPFHFIFKFIF